MKPEYWKTRLNDIDNVMRDVKKGIAEVICKSPAVETYILFDMEIPAGEV